MERIKLIEENALINEKITSLKSELTSSLKTDTVNDRPSDDQTTSEDFFISKQLASVKVAVNLFEESK